MNISEVLIAILGVGGFTGITMTFVLKKLLETGIKESIGNVYKKQIEDHKFLLKNSEKVFQYKLDASKSLYRIKSDMMPERRHPDMDWDEASEEIAAGFSSHEKSLNEFLCEFQATLSDDILNRVRAAISACSDGQFEFYWDRKMSDAVPNSTAKEKASEFYEALDEAIEMLRKEVHDMISLPST